MTETTSACNCLAERSRTETVTYSIAPRAGGGWAAWGAALTALLVRLTAAPTHCAIIDQRPNERYLQLMLGHGHARIEASGNGYLTGDFRLGESEERVLAGLGFRRPSTADPDDDFPENWWIDQPTADPAHLARTRHGDGEFGDGVRRSLAHHDRRVRCRCAVRSVLLGGHVTVDGTVGGRRPDRRLSARRRDRRRLGCRHRVQLDRGDRAGRTAPTVSPTTSRRTAGGERSPTTRR